MRGFRMRFQGRKAERSYKQLSLAEFPGSESMPSFKNKQIKRVG